MFQWNISSVFSLGFFENLKIVCNSPVFFLLKFICYSPLLSLVLYYPLPFWIPQFHTLYTHFSDHSVWYFLYLLCPSLLLVYIIYHQFSLLFTNLVRLFWLLLLVAIYLFLLYFTDSHLGWILGIVLLYIIYYILFWQIKKKSVYILHGVAQPLLGRATVVFIL